MFAKRVFILIIIGFCSLNLFSQNKETYIDISNDFIIEYPDNWELKKNEDGIITIFSPYESNMDINDIEEKIQITSSQWDEGSLEEFIDINFSPDIINDVFYDFSIFKHGKENINNLESYWFLFAYESEKEETIAGLAYFIKNKNKIISIIGICSTDDYVPIYKKIYLKIIRSIKSYMDSKTR